jgi:hypothetical protein
MGNLPYPLGSYVCAGQPEALGPFEEALFVPIQAMLSNDVVGEHQRKFGYFLVIVRLSPSGLHCINQNSSPMRSKSARNCSSFTRQTCFLRRTKTCLRPCCMLPCGSLEAMYRLWFDCGRHCSFGEARSSRKEAMFKRF